MRKVLAGEREWLRQVQYELTIGLREEAMQGWKSFVKYQRVRRNRKLSLYSLFMVQLYSRVNEARLKRANIEALMGSSMKQRVFKTLAGYVPYRQMKKARKNAAIEQRDQSLYKRAFTCF